MATRSVSWPIQSGVRAGPCREQASSRSAALAAGADLRGRPDSERTRPIGRGNMGCTMSVEIPPSGTRGGKGPPHGVVGRTLMGVARRVHGLTGSKMSGRPLLYLTTVGAKSGQARTAVVMPFPEGEEAWLIVASANGAARHPAWLYN